MKCPNCGAEVRGNTCEFCGSELPKREGNTTINKTNNYYAGSTNEKSKTNMIDKVVYPSVPALLKAECPGLYGNYLKMIGEDNNNPLVPVKKKNEVGCLPKEYLSTDIYKASREIKKMQKLASNILSSWYEKSDMGVKSLIDTNGEN